jgi:hypothetical protein
MLFPVVGVIRKITSVWQVMKVWPSVAGVMDLHQQVSILLSHFSRFFSFFRVSQKVKSEKVKKAKLHGIYISMTNLDTNYKAVGDGEMHLVGIIYPVATHRPCGRVWHHLHNYFPRPPSH